MTDNNIERISAGVDWLSMTLTSEDELYVDWRLKAHLALYEIAKEGYQIKQRALLGYVGVSAGNNFVGEKEGTTFAQFEGHHAGIVFNDLRHDSAHYSRIDLQITVFYRNMDDNQGKREYRRVKTSNAGLPANKRRRIDFFIGGNGGDTVYIGAPSSNQRGRIYNKEKQSEDNAYAQSWRYEVTLRNELCDQWLRGEADTGMSQADGILAYVSNWFAKRGANTAALSLGGFNAANIPKTVPSDAERKLGWLRTQVTPTVNWLCDQGYEYDLRELFYRITNDSHYPSCPISEHVHLVDSV